MKKLSLQDFISAYNRIKDYIYHTPLERSIICSTPNTEVFLKLENQQRTHSFKVRGAFHKILQLSEEEKKKGIMAVSSGNHGIAVSYASSLLGLKNTLIFVPKTTPNAKIEKIKAYGAQVIVTGDSYDEMQKIGLKYLEDHDLTFIDPYNKDYDIYLGAGTISYEILMENPEIDTILVPLSGGGLMTGVGYAAKLIKPTIRVIGVQTESCPGFVRSLQENHLYEEYPEQPSICEALMGGAGVEPFRLVSKTLDEAIVVKEESIKKATRMLIHGEKLMVEPSGAIGIAAMLEYPEKFKGSKVAVVVSGGNIDNEFLELKLGGSD